MSLPFDPYTPIGFDSLVGSQVTKLTPEYATAEFTVRDDLRQPFGLLHGGVYASVAESLASIATGVEVLKRGCSANGLSNQTSFLRPVLDGKVFATATRKHAGRTTWIWEVDFTDEQGRLCALSRMTIAVRELRGDEQLPAAAQ